MLSLYVCSFLFYSYACECIVKKRKEKKKKEKKTGKKKKKKKKERKKAINDRFEEHFWSIVACLWGFNVSVSLYVCLSLSLWYSRHGRQYTRRIVLSCGTTDTEND